MAYPIEDMLKCFMKQDGLDMSLNALLNTELNSDYFAWLSFSIHPEGRISFEPSTALQGHNDIIQAIYYTDTNHCNQH